AAILHNKQIDKLNLGNEIQPIRSGDKLKFVYLKMPNPLGENVIGFSDATPDRIGVDRKYIDYDLQFDKSFLQPLKAITTLIKWNTEKTSTLDDFFG
ncbi:MAG: hypothetical protein BV459_06360, partial [Thermoplasmata archaeon M11B2D]